MAEKKEGESIELGGRRFFQPSDLSIANDLWVEAAARRAGLDSLQINDDEDARAFAARVIAQAVDSSLCLQLLGGLLHPEGLAASDWTPEIAEQTAAHLARITDPDEKAAIRVMLADHLAFFFTNGLASALTSPTSSLIQKFGKSPATQSRSGERPGPNAVH